MKEIKVSIIMPIYNQEKYIRECLMSVCRQTLKEIEIIVVNDGSTDSSMDIVREIAAKDARITIIDKKNSGYGNSVNMGLDKARGKYIGIVETDDFIAPDMYEKLLSLTENETVEIVKGNFYDYYNGEEGTFSFINQERQNVPTGKICNVRTDPQILWGHPSIWSGIYKRSLIEDNHLRFIEAKGGGWVDNPFFFDTLFHANSYVWTDEPFYYYRKTNANSSSNNITNPVLPFERMIDNLDVAERNHFSDIDTLKYLYARALMYMVGAQKECDYGSNFEVIDTYAKKLMRKCYADVFTNEFNLPDQFLYYTNASPIKTLLNGCPKVLIYNWVPFDNENRFGGGVTVYCKNLIDTILKESPTTQIYFLSSGYAYDATRTNTYYRAIPNIFGSRVHQFEIVNSPVPADQWLIYRNPTVAIENAGLKALFKKFMDRFGTFQAVHFNNIEGLSMDVLDLKSDYPDTKFIYSIHNYNAMCLTGFYYQRHNHCICSPDHTAEDCAACSRVNMGTNVTKILYRRGFIGNQAERCIPEPIWIQDLDLYKLNLDVSAEEQLSFAKVASEKINKNCDVILAVSKRVYDIAIDNGYDPKKTFVSYIGTLVARGQVGHSVAQPKDGIRLVFLGSDLFYEEKGYPFLLKALSQLDKRYASKIDLVLTARNENNAVIYDSLPHFKSITVHKGYTHKDLKNILYDCDLSIVPVLWEDNLPQIAIESVAYGVPVLSSDAGGASELCNDERFKFKHGNVNDFLNKLKAFVDDPESIKAFWAAHKGLVTMKDHWQDINSYYKISERPVSLSAEDIAYLLQENAFLQKHFNDRDDDIIVIGNRAFDQEAKRIALQTFVENESLIKVNQELGLTPNSLYFRFIRKMDKWFPKGSKRRRFFAKLFGGEKRR